MEEWKPDKKNHCVVCQTKAESVQAEKTGLRMLENNTIAGILPFTYYYVDDTICFRYAFNELQSVSDYFAKKSADASDIRFLCSEPLQIFRRGSEYLLKDKGYVLDPSVMYWSRAENLLALCYLPGKSEGMKEGYLRFIEYLMERTDHKDKKAVSLVYGVYDLAASQGMQTDAILSFLADSPAGSVLRLSPVPEKTYGRVQQRLICAAGTLCASEKKTAYVIGKDTENDIVLPFGAAEAKQAVLREQTDGRSVENLSRKTDTCLNGIPLPVGKKTACKAGDILSFAGIAYRLE